MDFSKKNETIQTRKEISTKLEKAKHLFWKNFDEFRNLVGYSEKEKALIKLEEAKQSFISKTEEGKILRNCRKWLKDSETAYIKGNYKESKEKSEKVLRKVQVSDTSNFDAIYIGRVLKQRYPERLRDDLDKQFLALQAISHVQKTNSGQIFTLEQVREVFRKGFETETFEEMKPVISDLVENHSDITLKAEDRIGGQNLYRMEKELVKTL